MVVVGAMFVDHSIELLVQKKFKNTLVHKNATKNTSQVHG